MYTVSPSLHDTAGKPGKGPSRSPTLIQLAAFSLKLQFMTISDDGFISLINASEYGHKGFIYILDIPF